MSHHDVDAVIDAYRQALQDFVEGDSESVAQLYSRRDDVTLANPFGPPVRGWADVRTAMTQAAANFNGGSVRFEEVSRYATPDLAYVVQLEEHEVQLTGGEDTVRISLRVTMILRREGDAWLVAHRHADSITTARPISTALAS